MKNKLKKQNTIIVISLSGVILLLLVILGIKIISSNPERQVSSEMKFVYNFVVKKYNDDRENGLVKDGKYTSISLYKNGKELNYIAEFDVKTNKLIHLCVTNGSRKTDLNYEDITLNYIEENAVPERTTDICEFNK